MDEASVLRCGKGRSGVDSVELKMRVGGNADPVSIRKANVKRQIAYEAIPDQLG